jgi:Zn-dependent protease with chaperone function
MTVDFLTRVAIVGLASFAVFGTAAAILVGAGWRAALAARRGTTPRQLAIWLYRMRLAPTAAGLGAAITVICAFLLYEPNPHREAVGYAVLIAAAMGVFLLASGAMRIAAALGATARLQRRWPTSGVVRLDGCPIEIVRVDTLFPVVALMGLFRPRLIVASRVIDACTPGEMDAVVAHELAHLDSGDNLRRTLIAACPDVLAGTAVAQAIEGAWAEATELAADDRAAFAGAERRLDLASALVKVARLAVDVAPPPLPASALFRGEPVADRVRRLLAPPAEAASVRRWIAPVVAIAGALVTFILPPALPGLYEIVEAAIRLGR